MKELYAILRDFLDVAYDQESFLFVLESLETAYNNEEQTDAKLIANCTKNYLQSLHGELQSAINKLDIYIAENAKNNSK